MPFDPRWTPAKGRNSERSFLDRAARLLFVAAVILTTFAIGWRVGAFKIFPHGALSKAFKTAKVQIELLTGKSPLFKYLKFVNIAPDRVEIHRFEFIAADALADPILVPGGMGKFVEYCPGHPGCLAVEYDGAGELIHAYPYRPEEIEKTTPIADFPYEQPLGFSMRDAVYPSGVSRYPNGDLLVVFQSEYSFPFGRGIARIGRDGRPIWYRRDYSHHESHITEGDVALVPSLRIGERPITFNYRYGWEVSSCSNPYYDFVHFIDGEGRLLKEISIMDTLLESPYAPILHTDPCDPTHLNFVHELREDAAGGGIGPGDLVVSFRNIDTFAILNSNDHRLKRLVRGSFFRQHSVLHLEGTKFLMFDNLGRDDRYGPSRLLMIDIADGQETTLFPNDSTPAPLRNLYSGNKGGISISPDRRRVIITHTWAKKAVEVRLRDGAVLTVFNSVHDGSHLDALPEERKTKAVAFELRAIRYIASGGSRRTSIELSEE